MTRPAPLHPYQPIPWETFTLVETPSAYRRRQRRVFAVRVFAFLAICALTFGGLAGLSH